MNKKINKKMNKKASIFGWGVPIFIIAFIIFISMTSNQLSGQVKGQWQTDFLKESYLPAKQEWIKNNIIARNVGTEIAWELSQNGGFSKESECGQVLGKNLWNKENQDCFPFSPPLTNPVVEKAHEKFSRRNLPFLDASTILTFFVGRSSVIPFKSKNGMYFHPNYFMVDLGYSFDEYTLLIEQAQALLTACRDSVDLNSCLNTHKLDYWKYASCDTESYLQTNRTVGFCVVSPSLYSLLKMSVLSAPESLLMEKQIVTYQLALDFTPSNPPEVSGILVASEGNRLTITFPAFSGIEKYSLYLTDFPNPKTGERKEVQQDVFFNEKTWQSYDLLKPEENPDACQSSEKRGLNIVYLCTGKMIYVLETPSLKPIKATITSWKGAKESFIAEWISDLLKGAKESLSTESISS